MQFEFATATRIIFGRGTAGQAASVAKGFGRHPLVVMDGSPDGIFANHRKNLDAYISEARQKMYSIREELER